MEPTADPGILIEERGEDWVRYRRLEDGRRWEVHGVCDKRGDCLIGALIGGYEGKGPGSSINSHTDLKNAQRVLGRERIDSELDVPVTPEFDTCCGADIFRYVELESA